MPVPFGAGLDVFDGAGAGGRRLALVVENFGDRAITALEVLAVEVPTGWSHRTSRPLPGEVGPRERVAGEWLVVPAETPSGRVAVAVAAVVEGVRHELGVGVAVG